MPTTVPGSQEALRFRLDAVLAEIEAVKPLSAAMVIVKDPIHRAAAYVEVHFANLDVVVEPKHEAAVDGEAVALASAAAALGA